MTGLDRRVFELERRLLESQRMMEAEREAEIHRMREAQEAAAAEAAAGAGGAAGGAPAEVSQWVPKFDAPLRSAWVGRPLITGPTVVGDSPLPIAELTVDIGEPGLDQGVFSAWRLVVLAQWSLLGVRQSVLTVTNGEVWLETPAGERFATSGWSTPGMPNDGYGDPLPCSGVVLGVWDIADAAAGPQRFRLVAGPAMTNNADVVAGGCTVNVPLVVAISAAPGGPNWTITW